MLRRYVQKPLGLLLTVLALLLPAWQPAAAQGSDQTWHSVGDLPKSVTLANVYMIDANHGYAVGSDDHKGVLYQLVMANNQWKSWLFLGTGDPLWSVVAISDTNVWAVGDKGVIMHSSGAGWTQVDAGLTAGSLRTIQMLGNGEEGWAGGFETDQNGVPMAVMLHYQGGHWQRDSAVSGRGTVASLHLVPGGGWAVGSDQFWHITNGHWAPETRPDACNGAGGCYTSWQSVRALSADEAWAAGTFGSNCAICVTHMQIAHRTATGWQLATPNFGDIQNLPNSPTPPPLTPQLLNAINFTDAANGMVIGTWLDQGIGPFVLRYHSGVWSFERLPVIDPLQEPLAVSMPDPTHAVIVGQQGLVMIYGYPAPVLPPTTRVPDPHQSDVIYFDLVGHTLRGSFRNYWDHNGGLPVFGYPLTEEFSELNRDLNKPFTTQYFERQRYEYHAENQGTPYEVLLGRLGDEMLLQQGRDWHTFAPANPTAEHYFSQTGHAIAPQFWSYWQTHGLDLGDAGISERESLALFGYPISEPQMEKNSSGDTVLTQWFERARFEWHPDKPAEYQVLLGLLGSEHLALAAPAQSALVSHGNSALFSGRDR